MAQEKKGKAEAPASEKKQQSPKDLLEQLRSVPGFPREGFKLDEKGVWMLVQKKRRREEESTVEWVNILRTPLVIDAVSRPGDPEAEPGGFQWVLKGVDIDGRLKEVVVERGVTNDRKASLAYTLDNLGFDTAPGMEKGLAVYLKSFQPARRRVRIRRCGWHLDSNGNRVFVLPTGETCGPTVGDPFELESEIVKSGKRQMQQWGTLDEWKENIAKYAEGNPVMVFCLAAAFTAPLLDWLDAEGAGFHFFGKTSEGKTTAHQVAASVWGYGDHKDGKTMESYMRRWLTTDNALLQLAAKHNDLLLVLDEVKQTTLAPDQLGRIVYGLSNGADKERMDKDLTLRHRASWSITYLSSGEVSMRTSLEGGGGTQYGGQAVRCLDIPLTKGDVVRNPWDMTSKKFVDMLKANSKRYFGVAGPQFLEAVMGLVGPHGGSGLSLEDLKQAFQETVESLEVDGMSNEHKRAVSHLAAVDVGGSLACYLGILPFDEEEVTKSVVFIRDLWFKESMRLSPEQRTVLTIRNFIQAQRSRFQNWDDQREKVPFNRVGFYRTLNGEGLYMFYPNEFDKLCLNADRNEVCRLLLKMGLLKTQNSGKTSKNAETSNAKFEIRVKPPAHLAADGYPAAASRTGEMPPGKWPFYASRERILETTEADIWEGRTQELCAAAKTEEDEPINY